MKRIQFFEIEDQPWCPNIIRKFVTEFLSTVVRKTKIMQPTVEVLRGVLEKHPGQKIVVLGAGSGGGILDVAAELPGDTQIVLTDLYPHQRFETANSKITYLSQPVNATAVPNDLKGIRVMYNFFHHLSPDLAKRTLQNAVQDKQPVVIFEGTERSLKGIIVCLFIPLMVFLLTPFVRPFRISRLILTYIIPILPLVIFFDGLISTLRTYTLEEMRSLTADLTEFDWDIRMLSGPQGEKIPSLVGTPSSIPNRV